MGKVRACPADLKRRRIDGDTPRILPFSAQCKVRSVAQADRSSVGKANRRMTIQLQAALRADGDIAGISSEVIDDEFAAVDSFEESRVADGAADDDGFARG